MLLGDGGLSISVPLLARERMIGLRTDEVDSERATEREAESDDRMMLNKQRKVGLDDEGLVLLRRAAGG